MKRILLALICGWLLAPHGAQAKSSAAARLEVVKGPGTERCLDEQRLSHAVETRLRRRVFRADVPATLHVKVAFARDDENWSALLTMHDGAGAFLGRRSLLTPAQDCSALDDSLALVVALLVDSPPPPAVGESDQESTAKAAPVEVEPAKAATQSAAAQGTSASEAKATKSKETSPIVLPRDTPAARQPWRFQLAVEGVGAVGILPGFAPGVELGFGAKSPRLPELRLIAGWYAPRERRTSAEDAGARFDALYLGLEVCPLELESGISRWTLCAGQTLGRTHVAAFGFDENSTSNHFSYALLARAAVHLDFASHAAVRLGARAEVPLSRGMYGYGTPEGGQQGLYQPSPVAAVLDLGLVVGL